MITELSKAAYLTTIVLIVAFIVACLIGISVDRMNPPVVTNVVTPPVTITPSPTPTQTTYTETYSIPATITYQVKSVNRDALNVMTTNGEVLYFGDYDEWSTQVKRCVYTAKVIEMSGCVYLVKRPRIEVAYIPLDEGRDGMYVES